MRVLAENKVLLILSIILYMALVKPKPKCVGMLMQTPNNCCINCDRQTYCHTPIDWHTVKPRQTVKILSKLLPLNKVKLGLEGTQLDWVREKPMKVLTFGQLTLQCCHHPLTQFHSLLLPGLFRIRLSSTVHAINFVLSVVIHEKSI